MRIIEDILQHLPGVAKPQRKAMTALFMALFAFSGRATMANLKRYGAPSERRLADWCRRPFDFIEFNEQLLTLEGIVEHEVVAVFDPTFVFKSGKHTENLGSFYNGCASRAERGLEACVLGLVDLDEHTAYALEACQTPAKLDDEDDSSSSSSNNNKRSRIDFYAQWVCQHSARLRRYTRHLLADGELARRKLIAPLLEQAELHLVSKLRHDAHLRYLHVGPSRPGPGRRKLYDGKVDFSDLGRFERFDASDEEFEGFTAVLNHPLFKRNLRVVVLRKKKRSKHGHIVLFSTDIDLPPETIVRWYRARFQIEFVFRDAKQYTGLGHAQVCDTKGQEFFINASLTALNLLRIQHRQQAGPWQAPISIMTWKRRHYNDMLVDRISRISGLDPTTIKLHPNYVQVRDFGVMAA